MKQSYSVQHMNIPMYRVNLVKESTFKLTVIEDSSQVVGDVLSNIFKGADRELFVVLFLNSKNHIIGSNIVHMGTLNMSIVGPREVFKPAIIASASSIIVAHNHPSGDPTPSPEDYAVTEKLKEIGKILDIPVLDHIVYGEDYSYSIEFCRGIFH